MKMGQYFQHLRTVPWIPTFKWVDSIAEAADAINLPHEDYPMRISNTHIAIESKVFPMDTKSLHKIHKKVFGDMSYGGKFRDLDVRVGLHVAPKHQQVSILMEKLCNAHNPHSTHFICPMMQTEESLIDWYTDFETIHPFQDGNGRVGGIVVAQYSHLWFPNKGWLASQQ